LLELPALDQPWKGFSAQTPRNGLEQFLAVVDEDNPQRNIRVVADGSKQWTPEKVEVILKKSVV
jgi:hypothetical protein